LIDEKGHMSDIIEREALRVIRTAKQPFFININFSAPHYPLQAPQKFIDMNAKIGNADRRLFAGLVTHMDKVIGTIVETLAQEGQLDNTLIWFLSDNGGDPKWENRHNYYGGRFGPYEQMADNTPLRGGKSDVYEGGIRVPSFIYYPAALPARKSTAFVTFLDILPTVLGLAGATGPGPRDGFNMLAALQGKAKAREPEMVWLSTSKNIPLGGGKQDAIRVGKWKLVETQHRFRWLPFRINWPWPGVELFDIERDPEERTNLADTRPDLVEDLRGRLETYRRDSFGSFLPEEQRRRSFLDSLLS